MSERGNNRFSTVLVANRGEIAVRIIRALKEMGLRSVAVYSDADAKAPFVRLADQAEAIGGNAASESYLAIGKILDAARRSGAEALHPGYGFLSEDADFADACAASGVTFIGPRGDAIRAMGSKVAARKLMKLAGIPIVPGDTEPVRSIEDAQARAEDIGYAIAIKAVAGGGGKGLRVAHRVEEVKTAFEGASSEGMRFFANDTVYVERYLLHPRHIEVQIVADEYGNVIHLGERDCSVQRRHQKLIEEAPASVVDSHLREKIGAIAVKAAKSIGYTSVGTIEGLLVGGEYYFLEMKTRLQVEHPVTELVTGIDLVRAQIEIALGQGLPWTQDQIVLRGAAIECRINAEDASRGFLPQPGAVSAYSEPSGPGVRVDSGIEAGCAVSPFYDPLLAKLIVWDSDRELATRRMLRALEEFRVEGLKTLIPFHKAFLRTEEWASGDAGHLLLSDKSFLSRIEAPQARAIRAAE